MVELDFKGVLEKLKGVYFYFENIYYAVLDKIDEKIPVYKVVDKIDKKFPSFVLLLLFLLLLLIGIASNLDSLNLLFAPIWGLLFPSNLNATLKVVDETGNVLGGAQIFLEINSQKISGNSDEYGEFGVKLPIESITALAKISLEGFNDFNESIQLNSNETTTVELRKLSRCSVDSDCPSGKICSEGICRQGTIIFDPAKKLIVSNSKTGQIISGKLVTAAFHCDNGLSPQTKTTTTGEIEFDYPSGCASLTTTASAEGFESRTKTVNRETKNTYVELAPVEETIKGSIIATVKNQNGQNIRGVSLKLFKQSENILLDQTMTGNSGNGKFENLSPGIYKISATLGTAFAEKTGITVTANQASEIRIDLAVESSCQSNNDCSLNQSCVEGKCVSKNQKKIFLKIIDSVSKQAVSTAFVSIFLNSTPFDSKQADVNGIYSKIVSPENPNFKAIVQDSNHMTKTIASLAIVDLNNSIPQTIELIPTAAPQNFVKILAHVQEFEGTKRSVSGAKVLLYSNEFPDIPIPCNSSQQYCLTNSDGNAMFSNLSSGNYRLYAEKGGTKGDANNLIASEGQTIYSVIELVFDTGKIEVNVKDNETKEAISNATVNVYDAMPPNAGTLIQANGRTNSLGKFTSSDIPSNKTVYFEVVAENYIGYASAAFPIIPSQAKNFTVYLDPKSIIPQNGNVLLEFLGVYDSQNNYKVNIIDSDKTSAKIYYFRFKTTLADTDANYSNLYNHVRVGSDSQDCITASNYLIKIRDVANVSQSNPQPFTALSKCFESSNVFSMLSDVDIDAKSANTLWEKPKAGMAYYETVKIAIEPNLEEGTPIELHYQAKSLIDSIPFITQPFIKSFLIGKSFCSGNCPDFTWRFWLKEKNAADFESLDNFTNSTEKTIDLGKEYSLKYEILNTGKSDVSGLELSAENKEPSGAIEFTLYPSQPAQLFPAPLALAKNSSTAVGSPLELKALNDSVLTKLFLDLAADQQKLSDDNKTLYFEIEAKGEIEVLGLPSTILPLIPNQAIGGIVQDKATHEKLPNAIVSIYNENGDNLTPSLQTDADGKFNYIIESPPTANSGFDLNIIYTGYKKFGKTIPVQSGGGFDQRYDCVKATPQTASIIPSQSVSLAVSTENCPESVSIQIETQLNSNPETLNLSENDSKNAVLTAKPDNQGLFNVYIKAKFASDIGYYLAKAVEVTVSDPNSCFSISPAKIELPAPPLKANVTITNSCYANLSNPWMPSIGIDSQQVLFSYGLPSQPITFDWWIKADYLEEYYVADTGLVDTFGWKNYSKEVSDDNPTTARLKTIQTVEIPINNTDGTKLKFLSYAGDDCSNLTQFNYIHGPNPSTNAIVAIQTTDGLLNKQVPCNSNGCNWTNDVCIVDSSQGTSCPASHFPCRYREIEIDLEKSYTINSISAEYSMTAYYSNSGQEGFFPITWQIYGKLPIFHYNQNKIVDKRTYETAHSSVSTNNAPQEGQVYDLGAFNFDLKSDSRYKGGVFPDANISIQTSNPEIQAYVSGNRILAKYVGIPKTSGTTTAGIENVSIDQNETAAITITDYIRNPK